jgi:hypothetical protein
MKPIRTTSNRAATLAVTFALGAPGCGVLIVLFWWLLTLVATPALDRASRMEGSAQGLSAACSHSTPPCKASSARNHRQDPTGNQPRGVGVCLARSGAIPPRYPGPECRAPRALRTARGAPE